LAISSTSLPPLSESLTVFAGDDIRRPRLLPRVEVSLALIYRVEDAHREFLRIADVTERISEYKTCFVEASGQLFGKALEEVIKTKNVSYTSTYDLPF
jgi:hypothetical protein